MKSMKQVLPFCRKHLPFFVLFATIFILYATVSNRIEDDVWFASVFWGQFDGDLFAFLNFRYHTWSTRVLLEALMLPLLKSNLLFKLSISAWYVAIATAMVELLKLRTEKERWVVCLSLLLIPMAINTRAGYVCTTINYVATTAAFLWAILPTVKRGNGQKTALWQDILACLLMVVACNMEFYVPPFLVLIVILLIRSLRQKRLDWGCFALLAIVLASGFFAANSPMSTITAYETVSSNNPFPGYELLNIGEKLIIGITSTAGGLISTYRYGDNFFVGTLTTCLLLALFGWQRVSSQSGFKRIGNFVIWSLPLAITLTIGIPARLAPEGSSMQTLFFNVDSGWACPLPGGGNDWLFPFMLAVLFFASLIYCLWCLSPELGCFGSAALLSRILMGVSISIYTSGMRTFYLLLFVLCAATAYAVIKQERWKHTSWNLLALGGIAMTTLNFITIFRR